MSNHTITNNWAKFSPRDYLHEYYSDVGSENLALLQFAVKAFRDIPSNGVLLDFGGGPTIYPLIAAANKVVEIHFCDYLDANLNEIRQWLQGHPSAFDWHAFVKITLELEHQNNDVAQSISQRETLIRHRVTQVFKCDANNSPPISEPHTYDILVTNFCAESATGERAQWRRFFHNIMSLVKPEGTVLLSTLKGATSYSVGEKIFPAVNIKEDDLTQALTEEGFDAHSMVIESVPADRSSRKYEGLIMAKARKLVDR